MVKINRPKSYTKSYEVNALDRELTCPGLTPYTTYTVSVGIVDSAGVEGVPATLTGTKKTIGKISLYHRFEEIL